MKSRRIDRSSLRAAECLSSSQQEVAATAYVMRTNLGSKSPISCRASATLGCARAQLSHLWLRSYATHNKRQAIVVIFFDQRSFLPGEQQTKLCRSPGQPLRRHRIASVAGILFPFVTGIASKHKPMTEPLHITAIHSLTGKEAKRLEPGAPTPYTYAPGNGPSRLHSCLRIRRNRAGAKPRLRRHKRTLSKSV